MTENGLKLRRNKHFLKRRGEEIDIMEDSRVNESDNNQSENLNQSVTRSGRLILRPKRFDDYVTH